MLLDTDTVLTLSCLSFLCHLCATALRTHAGIAGGHKAKVGGAKAVGRSGVLFGALGVGLHVGLHGWEQLKQHWRQER
jgi:hypothetical protein